MAVWKRFPVPEFDHGAFKGMAWKAPAYLSRGEIDKLIENRKSGDSSVYGCYAVMPSKDFFSKLDVRGEQSHALMCVLPDREVTIVGRSNAWAIQRAWIVDSLDPEACNVVADWRTSRPMNTVLGPGDGMTRTGGVLFVVCAHAFGDHWLGNRTITDNDWDGAEANHGFRILSASVEESGNFHDCNITFEWTA